MPGKVTGKPNGRPPKKFTREQLDEASDLLGRRVYPSRVATELRQKFPDLNVPQSYKLIEAAQREVIDALSADGGSILAAQVQFLMSVIARDTSKDRDRIAASAVIVKLLGLSKLIKQLSEAGDIDEFLAGVLSRRAARLGESEPPKPPEAKS